MKNSVWAAGFMALMGVAGAEEASPTNELVRAAELAKKGVLRFSEGQYHESESVLREVLGIRERLLPPDHAEVAATLNDLGATLFSQGQYRDAEPLYRRAVAIFRLYPERRPDLTGALLNLASLYREQRRFSDAEPVYTEVFRLMRDPGVKDSTAGNVYNDYGMMLKAKGEWEGAEAAFNHAAEIRERLHDPGLPVVWAAIGDLHYSRGNYDAAEAMFRKSVSACDIVGKDDRRCGSALNGLGVCLMRHGLDDKARVQLEHALRIFERNYGSGNPKVAALLNNLGNIAEHKRQYKQAENYLNRAMNIWIAAYGPEHPDVASANANLGSMYQHRHQWTKAEMYYQRALAIDETAGKDRQRVARDLNNLGVLYSSMKRHGDAESYLARAVHEYESIPDSALSPGLAGTLLNLANQYAKTKRYEEAVPLYKRALAIYERHPSGDASSAAALDAYAAIARRNDDYADAEKAQAFAMRLRVRDTIARERLR